MYDVDGVYVEFVGYVGGLFVCFVGEYVDVGDEYDEGVGVLDGW